MNAEPYLFSMKDNAICKYQDKVDVINIVTAPEIEMLIIISEHEYDRYKRSGKSPSGYCKENLHIRRIKNYDYVYSYFSDSTKLIAMINEYHRLSNIPRGELTLKNLLK